MKWKCSLYVSLRWHLINQLFSCVEVLQIKTEALALFVEWYNRYVVFSLKWETVEGWNAFYTCILRVHVYFVFLVLTNMITVWVNCHFHSNLHMFIWSMKWLALLVKVTTLSKLIVPLPREQQVSDANRWHPGKCSAFFSASTDCNGPARRH